MTEINNPFSEIDVTFDFTENTPDYWDGFWERQEGLGYGASDPDATSLILQRYHQLLWSRKLPNGEMMELQAGYGPTYLTWKDFRFGSDSITTGFRYKSNEVMIRTLEKEIRDYKAWMEKCIRKTYTMGGMIIFPKTNSINVARGSYWQTKIRDRWDLTLECIRRYYQNEESPLFETLKLNKAFFDLFVDFKGYVDFFFLQECVTNDYKKVKLWLDTPLFKPLPLPETVEQYTTWMQNQLDFVDKRNKRINDFIQNYRPE